jgi:hypothetical protein
VGAAGRIVEAHGYLTDEQLLRDVGLVPDQLAPQP